MGSLGWAGEGVGVCGEKFLVRNGTIAILFSANSSTALIIGEISNVANIKRVL